MSKSLTSVMSNHPYVSCHGLPLRCDPQLLHSYSYRTPSCHCESFLSASVSHLGATGSVGREGAGEDVLIVISLANDLWSIFRLEPWLGRKRAISVNQEWVGHFSRLDDPHRDVEEYAKPSLEAQLIIQPPSTPCRPPPAPYPLCPLQGNTSEWLNCLLRTIHTNL